MRCYACKGENLEDSSLKQTITVGENVFRADVPSLRCTDCGEETVSGDALRGFELRVSRHLIATRMMLEGPSFRFIRKALGLSRKEAAALFETTPDGVRRFEEEGTRRFLPLASTFAEKVKSAYKRAFKIHHLQWEFVEKRHLS